LNDIPIFVATSDGLVEGQLGETAAEVVVAAAARSSKEGLTKEDGIERELRDVFERDGLKIGISEIRRIAQLVNKFRLGKRISRIEVVADSRGTHNEEHSEMPADKGQPSSPNRVDASFVQFFEAERTFPDDSSKALFESLIGLGEQKQNLLTALGIIFNFSRLGEWSKRHHKKDIKLLETIRRTVPLIILEGDVGTGKTALAETVGDALSRQGGFKHVHLLRITTQVRGRGHVGEMSDLIVQAFVQAERRARSHEGEPLILMLDESDALAESRASAQMHHEDKAGVNTLLQRLDLLRTSQTRMAVLFVTNRPNDLDPAIRRRAALDLKFERPDNEARKQIVSNLTPELNWTHAQLEEIARLTGPTGSSSVGFTASDIAELLLPSALRKAFLADAPLTVDIVIETARAMEATRPFAHGQAKSS
jgi:SpoVK/Ycf46/Vps4 family AAA+-type ATPase